MTPPPPAADSTRPDAPPRPTPFPAGNRFFAWIRGLGITREPGWIGGVAAGVAARLGIDPLIVRGILVVVAILGGPALLVYAAAWLLLPDEHDEIHLENLLRGRVEVTIAGIGALVLLSLLPVTQGFWSLGTAWSGEPYWGQSLGHAVWTIAVLGAIVWFVVWIARRSTPVPQGARPMPSTAADAATADAGTTANASATPDAGTAAQEEAAPVSPARDASAEELAAWREQQSLWKAQHDAFRREQSQQRYAATAAAQAAARADRAAKREVDRAERARTRSNPLFTFVVIGLSLVGGGLAVLLIGDGSVDRTSVVIGLSITLAVLAVGIIINGIIGRRAGGASGLAIVVLIPLVVLGIAPHDPGTSASNARFTPVFSTNSPTDGYVVGVGDVTLDLRDYFSGGSNDPASGEFSSESVSLLVGSGNVTVLVPADEHVRVSSTVGSGSISAPDVGQTSGSGAMRHLTVDFPADSTAGGITTSGESGRTIDVQLTVGAGQIDLKRDATATRSN